MDTRKGTVWLGLVTVVLAGCATETPPDEKASVRACFDGYKKAILDQDGEKAVAFVDQKTLDYYEKMLDLARRGDRKTIRNFSTLDKLMVLLVRHLVPPESVEQMTGETLFVHGVNEGWIGKQSVMTNELGSVAVSGASATGVHITAGQQTPIKWVFHKEEDRWKIDLTSVQPSVDQAMKQVMRRNGLREDEFLTSLIESASGRKVADTVWDPVGK